MPSAVANNLILKLLNGTIDLDTDTIKCMLLASIYTPDSDHDFVDDLTASEISVTGYTAGFGGAGRKTATITPTIDNTNNGAVIDVSNLTWTSLGAGATIGAAALIKEITNDAASIIVAIFDVTNTATNGGDFTLTFSSNSGDIRFFNV